MKKLLLCLLTLFLIISCNLEINKPNDDPSILTQTPDTSIQHLGRPPIDESDVKNTIANTDTYNAAILHLAAENKAKDAPYVKNSLITKEFTSGAKYNDQYVTCTSFLIYTNYLDDGVINTYKGEVLIGVDKYSADITIYQDKKGNVVGSKGNFTVKLKNNLNAISYEKQEAYDQIVSLCKKLDSIKDHCTTTKTIESSVGKYNFVITEKDDGTRVSRDSIITTVEYMLKHGSTYKKATPNNPDVFYFFFDSYYYTQDLYKEVKELAASYIPESEVKMPPSSILPDIKHLDQPSDVPNDDASLGSLVEGSEKFNQAKELLKIEESLTNQVPYAEMTTFLISDNSIYKGMNTSGKFTIIHDSSKKKGNNRHFYDGTVTVDENTFTASNVLGIENNNTEIVEHYGAFKMYDLSYTGNEAIIQCSKIEHILMPSLNIEPKTIETIKYFLDDGTYIETEKDPLSGSTLDRYVEINSNGHTLKYGKFSTSTSDVDYFMFDGLYYNMETLNRLRNAIANK